MFLTNREREAASEHSPPSNFLTGPVLSLRAGAVLS
jgi:hypothetical protein